MDSPSAPTPNLAMKRPFHTKSVEEQACHRLHTSLSDKRSSAARNTHMCCSQASGRNESGPGPEFDERRPNEVLRLRDGLLVCDEGELRELGDDASGDVAERARLASNGDWLAADGSVGDVACRLCITVDRIPIKVAGQRRRQWTCSQRSKVQCSAMSPLTSKLGPWQCPKGIFESRQNLSGGSF